MSAAPPEHHADIAVVGGGIVGLATAYRLSRCYPDLRLVVLEKESGLAQHQTGHNSGVIHSGLYYKPGSRKAHNCVTGAELMKEFCRRHEIAFEVCGKVVVAVDASELPRLEELHRRGKANGVPGVSLIGPERLREIEPHVAGVQALHVPSAGIIDYCRVAERFGELFRGCGGQVRLETKVSRVRHEADGVVLETNRDPLRARFVVNCAGLHSDRVARLEGAAPEMKIVPFRGEYYELAAHRHDLVRALIYPVPDPRFPFLGVHFTRLVHGGVEAGPNAVLALAREGYRKSQIRLGDMFETLGYGGFWRMALKYWRTGMGELARSFSKRAFVAALARLIPEIQVDDLVPGGSGVRAQAIRPSGEMVDDFVIVARPRFLHVCNAPSPAATASLSIAIEIVHQAASAFELGAAVAGSGEEWLS